MWPQLARARAAVKLVRRWAQHQDQPSGRLLMAIVELVLLDLADEARREAAQAWLAGCDDHPAVAGLGLDGDGIRLVAHQAGLTGVAREAGLTRVAHEVELAA